MSAINNFRSVLKYYNNVKENILQDLTNNIGNVVKELLSGQDKIQYLELTAYTTYFNDGEENEYWAHFDDLYVNGERPGYEYKSETYWNNTPNPIYDPEIYAYTNKVRTFLHEEVGQELFKEVFGDHIKVTFYANGKVEEEKYEEHD